MAEFSKVMREHKRMCNHILCRDCQLASVHNGHDLCCADFYKEYPEEAEDIVMKWSAKHPVMTNAMKFKEVFGYDFQDAFGALGCSEWLDDEYKKGKQYE